MTVHLDTNYIVGAVRKGSPQVAQIDAWEMAGVTLAVSTMAWAEFLCGPLTPGEVDVTAGLLGRPLPITAADAAKGA